MRLSITKRLSPVALVVLLLSACSDTDRDGPTNNSGPQFTVQVTNLTLSQPLSPVAAILHRSGFNVWTDGETASVGLEMLAEGGENTQVLADAAAATQHVASVGGQGPIAGGASESLNLTSTDFGDINLTVVTMLVNTNDAFTGLNAVDISGMTVGESRSYTSPTWDSGTEANSEAVGSIPGPADGGEGFNADRSGDVDFISFHRGVITVDDGLASSTLDQSHRFDNPTMRVVVTRTQ